MASMAQSQEAASTSRRASTEYAARLGALLIAGVVIGVWALNTPGGLLGKADAVAYAVCHRIELRSFHLGDRPLPLCARCTGLYLGVMLTFAFFAFSGRLKSGQNPPRRLWIPLVIFGALYVGDGLNSYLHFFPAAPHVYPPSNSLRLITGTFAGVALVNVVVPTMNQVLWSDWRRDAALRSWRELGLLSVGASGLILLVSTGNPLVLYPLALISSLGVILMLSMLYTTLVVMMTGWQNFPGRWIGILPAALAGVALAFLQIGFVDLIRYLLTGTWAGFTL
jgi:uncharacterized membrane protein